MNLGVENQSGVNLELIQRTGSRPLEIQSGCIQTESRPRESSLGAFRLNPGPKNPVWVHPDWIQAPGIQSGCIQTESRPREFNLGASRLKCTENQSGVVYWLYCVRDRCGAHSHHRISLTQLTVNEPGKDKQVHMNFFIPYILSCTDWLTTPPCMWPFFFQ